ncbi:DUF4124 domain-containing protein [Gilvimarinus polysaccharolyticus]|uniref:DUF4124 domain-containing protein n=1 Tax=Gilvimarinus polysaccharolyticus TaxID=863921 RepID=UPI000673AF7B|nr:DUF4124 domain-containing protein [Gilvimarinus polysaccharolyticus]
MHKTFSRMLGLAALIGALGSTQAIAETFYKWTDEDGGVHFGTRPPSGQESLAIKPQTGHSEPVDYSHFSSEAEKEAASAKQDNTEKASNKDPERCESAKDNLEILNRGGRIREPTDDGSFTYLDEEQKAKRIEQAQAAIKESC